MSLAQCLFPSRWQQRIRRNITTTVYRCHRAIPVRSAGAAAPIVSFSSWPTIQISRALGERTFSHSAGSAFNVSGFALTRENHQQKNNIIFTLQHPSQSRSNSSSLHSRPKKVPRLSDGGTLEEAIESTYNHMDILSPRDMAAFWTAVPQFLRKRGRGPSKRHDEDQDEQQLHLQFDKILVHTLEEIPAFGYRDLAQTTLGFAKIVKNIGGHGKRLPEGSPQQILHNLFIGENSQNKEFIFSHIAVASLPILQDFDARSLSNFIYAYGLAEYVLKFEDGSTFFDILALEAIPNLTKFNSFDISNMLWGYSNVKASNPRLFEETGDVVIARDLLKTFNPQDITNMIWAYSTAEELHPKLFEEVADHIASLDNLGGFIPQALSNIAWAYAAANESQPKLFKKIADAVIKKETEFTSQGITNLLWAYATNGQIDQHLFKSLAPTATALVRKCNSQDLANIAWSYAVANVSAPSLFNQDFINSCLEKNDEFTLEGLSQLHQWHLWQEDLNSNIDCPHHFKEKCYEAFLSRVPRPSALQDDVISELSSIGLQPEEEKLTERGYRLDALVEVNGEKIGIEVDGPSHFLGRKPTGSTILKHRQVTTLEGIRIVSVPYWEWDKLGKDRSKKQQYLRALLGLN